MRPAKYPYREHDGLLAFAHRGGAGAWPENTMPAFQGAVDLGYRYIQPDVHATRHVVLLALHHDQPHRLPDLQPTTPVMASPQIPTSRLSDPARIPLPP